MNELDKERLYELLDVITTEKFRVACPFCKEAGEWGEDADSIIDELAEHIDRDHKGED